MTKTNVMECMVAQINEKSSSNADPDADKIPNLSLLFFRICDRKAMANLVFCRLSGNWIHVNCARLKVRQVKCAMVFKYSRCTRCHDNVDNQKE